MKPIVLSVLWLCSVAYGYEPSLLSRASSYASSRWRTSRYRPSSTLEMSRLSSLPHSHDIQTPAAIRMPKMFDPYVPILNSAPTNDVRSGKEFSFTTTGGLRTPSRKAFAVDVEVTKAEKHFLEMEAKASCALPRKRVICVQDHYPDADIIYRPACTILHRCDRHSGCCRLPKTCQPASSEQVTLFFKTSDPALSVVRLPFTNHTSCRCDIGEDGAPPTVTTTPVHPASLGAAHGREVEETVDVDYDEDEALVGNTVDSCPRCPRPFNRRVVRGLCQCDCFDGDSTCISVKNGREKIAEEERRCVQRGSCNRPSCGAGHYFNLDFGECREPTYERLALGEAGQTTTELSGEGEPKDSAKAADPNKGEEVIDLDDEIEASRKRRHQRRNHKKHV